MRERGCFSTTTQLPTRRNRQSDDVEARDLQTRKGCQPTSASRHERSFHYTKIGLTPDGSSTWFLPSLIDLRRTKELFLLNRLLSADEAIALGLVNRQVAPQELLATVDQVSHQLATGLPLAI